MADEHLNAYKEQIIKRYAGSKMNLRLNERYGNIETAQMLHGTVHLIQLKRHLYLKDDREKMMYEFMIKLLSKWRDEYLTQGLKGVISETGIDINQLLSPE